MNIRIIKFRIWDNFCKEMLPPNSSYSHFYSGVSMDLGGILRNPTRFIPSQFTGLKDRSGREVYEGDILQYTDLHPDVVEFLDGEYILRNPKSKLYGSLRGANCSRVIGNIYENPELLK